MHTQSMAVKSILGDVECLRHKNESLKQSNTELLEALEGMIAIEDSVTQGMERELREKFIPMARAAIKKAKDGR